MVADVSVGTEGAAVVDVDAAAATAAGGGFIMPRGTNVCFILLDSSTVVSTGWSAAGIMGAATFCVVSCAEIEGEGEGLSVGACA